MFNLIPVFSHPCPLDMPNCVTRKSYHKVMDRVGSVSCNERNPAVLGFGPSIPYITTTRLIRIWSVVRAGPAAVRQDGPAEPGARRVRGGPLPPLLLLLLLLPPPQTVKPEAGAPRCGAPHHGRRRAMGWCRRRAPALCHRAFCLTRTGSAPAPRPRRVDGSETVWLLYQSC